MLSIKKYAAIDIGSNAIRLLISNVIEEEGKPVKFKKSSLVRVPIRLGSDVFLNHAISEENTERLLDSMMAFKLLMKSHKVESYKACATSAMREANNGEKVAKRVLKHSNIKIDIIDGEEEAAIIASTEINDFIDNDKTYLYVDVGGGSTEFTVIKNSNPVASKSFKIGTVRLLNDIVKKNTWLELEQWIKTNTRDYDKVDMIGSGGNINKIFKISGKAIGKPLTYFYLTAYFNMLNSYSYEERITELDLNLDRADVIIPATRIYLSAMKWCGAKHLYVPKMGLSDGIIRYLYQDSISGNSVV
jgi:exopolyphosphatase/guanosine-5'-triphosphate,3'-diphosphate pyrophosphatase